MAKLTIKQGRHYLDWRDPSRPGPDGRGKRARTCLGKVGTIARSQLDAILKAKEFELSTAATLLHANRRPAPTFSEFAHDYLIWHKGKFPDSHFRVAQIVDDHILPEFGHVAMNLVSVDQAEAWLRKRLDLQAAGTVVKEFRTLMAMLNRAVDAKKLDANPLKGAVEAPQDLVSRPHHWISNKGDLARLYRQSSWGPYWKLMANCGIRRGEALILRWDWITDGDISIQSTGEERTKSGSWRKVPKSDGAREALKAIRKVTPKDAEYVFPQIYPESLSRACAKDLKRAKLGGSLHSLRHTYICHLLLNGIPVRTVQLLAGHSSITTTEKYAYQVLKIAPRGALRLAI